jgi:hypothetical protein
LKKHELIEDGMETYRDAWRNMSKIGNDPNWDCGRKIWLFVQVDIKAEWIK